jgi:ATP-dependent helicase/nuclease subunit A
MTVAFTDEQRHAIETRTGSLFLHANAGSGKTSVLVERFVRSVLEDDVPVDRILAITFTEKAAAELKLRIRARFLELGKREQARSAEGAWISTIHGFCSRLLRTHPLAAGIDPEYRVLDEPEAERIGIDAFERSLEAFLAREAAEGGARLELLAAYTPDKLQTMVRTVHSRLRSRGERDPALPPLDVQSTPSDGSEAREIETAMRAALAELNASGANGVSVTRELARMRRCAALIEALGDRLADPHDLKDLLLKPGSAKALKTPAFERLAEAQRAYFELCTRERALRDYELLRELLALFHDRYTGAKEARSGLDFEDLQLMARDLLATEPGLREHYRERFAHLMVDEFQDTNRLQTSILDLLANDNLFTVGDANQSIYLFRNADVGVFRDARAVAAERGRDARIAHNFRSRPELLEVLNRAFGEAFGEEFEPLRWPGSGEPEPPRSSPSVDLLIVDSDGWKETFEQLPFGAPQGTPPWRAAEARLLAHRIAELAGPDRPYEPGDVAVLLRASTDVSLFERAIADRGLPTYVAGGRGYWSQQQVGDLRAYLAALANPRDELALYSLIASPLVGASLDALAVIGLRSHELGRDLWWTLEETFGGDGSGGLANSLSERDRSRIAAFVSRFVAEREAAPRLSLETLIDRAVTGSGYDRTVLRMPGGERRMANVRKLMRLAREYEAEEGRELRGFIDFVAEQDLLRAREGEAPLETEGIDAVRLMTIHAAKGLEFPVVCVADLGRQGRDDKDALRVTDDGRVGISIASIGGGSTAGMELEEIKEDQARLADEEERRVFYVAMTRAQEHLVLSGATRVEKWPEPRRLGPPIDWIWRALAPGLPDGEHVPGVRYTVCTPNELESALPRDCWSAPETVASSNGSAAAVQPPLLAAVESAGAPPVGRLSYSSLESYRRCGYRFYLERVARVSTKTPRLADQAGEPVPTGLAALTRGTVIHQLLERMDLGRPTLPSATEVTELLEAQEATFDDADVEGIRELLQGFIDSELRARLAAASPVRHELPFTFTLRPHGASGASLLVNGVVDVHALERGSESVLVVDYKSDPVEGLDLAATCEEKYGTQRLIYALAALRSGAPSAEVVHVFLERPAEPVSAVYVAADLPRLEQELLALAEGVIEGRFVPTAEPHRELCATCPGRAALCSWDESRTLAER